MRASTVLALLAPIGLLAQEKLEHSLLWRISTPGVARYSYLYGTVHSRDERAYQFGDSVLPALDRCAVVAGELDLGADQQMAMAMLTTLRLPDGKKLEDLYKKREWVRVEVMMKDRLGPMAPMLYSLKPFFVMALFSEAEMGDDRPLVLDQFLQRRGTSNGQRVIGIETMNEQMAAIDAIPLEEQARMLLDHVDHQGYPGITDAMLDAYARQDLEALLEVGEQAGGMPEELERSLLTERNTRMVQRMDTLLRAGDPVFFLIGAAHLPTPTGLIAGLRAQGHTVEAVISAYTPALRSTPVVKEER
ncbi:MAG: TraB/GumN family protein [Flavobacteriales bacterium]